MFWCCSQGFPWTQHYYQLKALYFNTQNFEKNEKADCSSSFQKVCCSVTTLDLTSHKLPKRHLQSWISSPYPIYHTTSTFSQNWKNPFVEVCLIHMKRIVRTWLKDKSVELFHDSFKNLVYHWKKCAVSDDDCGEVNTDYQITHFKDYFPVPLIKIFFF